MLALALVSMLALGQVTSDLPTTKKTPPTQKTQESSVNSKRLSLIDAIAKGNAASGLTSKYTLWESAPTATKDSCFVVLTKDSTVVGLFFFLKDGEWTLIPSDFVELGK